MSDIEIIQKNLFDYSVRVYELLRNNNIISNQTKSKNISGDTQNKIDLLADELIEVIFNDCHLIYGFISEEREKFQITNSEGKFIISIDPLDGSQNIDIGLNVGAIFGIYQTNDINNIKSGRNLIASGYTIFSTSLINVWADKTVTLYRFNFLKNDWDIIKNNHTIPNEGKIYSINEGISEYFFDDLKILLKKFKGRSIRWMACMVTDVHRNLMEGGCFIYPKNKKHKNGRLRLIYELYPMAFIWEAAGGKAYSDLNKKNILDLNFPHDNLHKKEGCILVGAKENTFF